MRKYIKIVIIILFISAFVCQTTAVFGQDANEEVKKINRDIQAKKDEVKKNQQKQEEYTKALRSAQSQKATLSNQLVILDNRLAKAELDIEDAQSEIDITELEIKKIDMEIKSLGKEIEKEKDHLENILRLIQKQDNTSTLEIILLNDNLSDFLSQIKYLEDINSEVKGSVDGLSERKKESETNLAALDEKNKELVKLKQVLEDKKSLMDSEKEGKAFMLSQTRSSEKEYQRLIQLSREEQEEAASEIAGLEKTVRDKIASISVKKLEFNDAGFIWPVTKNTITAYFHDSDYPFKYIFEHPAVDIKAGQGTAIKAAASGYVAKAKDAGKGYSYIMILHGNGLATVYGHVSRIYVDEEEYVAQGQIIGASGGLPGTPGAGRLTTGPHLHFEIRLNGIPVNPLEYLP